MTRRIRVFHLIKSLGRGGAETLLAQVLPHSDPRFEYSCGYFLPRKDALVQELEASGANVTCFGGTTSTAIFSRLPTVIRYLVSWRADIVHCHLPLAGIVGRVAGRVARIPVLYTEHNLMERYHPMTRRLHTATWPLLAHVIAVSTEVGESARRQAGEKVPISVIENGVSTTTFAPDLIQRAAMRKKLGVEEGTILIGTCAVFRTQKRLDLWILAAKRLLAKHDDVSFLIVGDGPLRDEIEAFVHEHGLSDCVLLTGLKNDVRPFLSAMDLYLMSSDFEGLPIALLEAMAMSLPVVSTTVGGISEVVVEGVTGKLVPPGDHARLSSAVTEVLADRAQLVEMGRAGRARVAEHYTIQRTTERIEEIYDSVLC